MRRLFCIGLSRLLTTFIRAALPHLPKEDDVARDAPHLDDLSVW